MAGFFGLFDFTKPGKGVDADEPRKRAPIRYFELLGRNFWRFVILNLLYTLCLLPVILAFHYAFFDPVVNYSVTLDYSAMENNDALEGSALPEDATIPTSPLGLLFIFVFGWPAWTRWFLVILSALAQGPLTCGLTYCLRNAVREEHYWRSDFWARARKNLKQGLIFSFIDAAVFYMGCYNIILFLYEYVNADSMTRAIIVVSLVAFPLYLAMRSTTYTQAVTFDLTVPQILRNSFILALAGLPRHILNGLICLVVLTLTLLISGYLELLLLPLIALTLMGYTAQFSTWPVVARYLIKKDEE